MEVTLDLDLDDVDFYYILQHVEGKANDNRYADSISETCERISVTQTAGILRDLRHDLAKLLTEIETLKKRLETQGLTTPEQDAVEIARLKTMLRQKGIPV